MKTNSLMKIFAFLAAFFYFSEAVRASAEGVEGPGAGQPALSLDHAKLVFVSNINGSRDIWLADADGKNQINLTPWPDSWETEPDWSPDGRHIAFTSTRNAAYSQIWTMNADGSNPAQLTLDIARHNHPRYSPDGSSIMYVVQRKQMQSHLMLISTDGSNQQAPLTPTLWGIDKPVWSPDGKHIAYEDCDDDGKACNIFVTDLYGSNIKQLTFGNFHDWNPNWGIQGILFTSNRNKNQRLWVIKPDGTGLQNITAPDLTHVDEARWISGTSGFVFSRFGTNQLLEGDTDIWSVAAIGAPAQRLTHTPPNLPPVANAGRNQKVRLGSLVTLDGSASKDPEKGALGLEYQWWQTDSGIEQNLMMSESVNPQFIPMAKGAYTFRLSVRDEPGHDSTNAAQITITVPMLGDIDGDGDVDNDDLAKITAKLNKPASNANDLRDLNGDMKIDALDASQLVSLCTKPRCAL